VFFYLKKIGDRSKRLMTSRSNVEEKKGDESIESVKSSRVIAHYEIFDTIGKGGYSWVKKGKDTRNGAFVALKFLKREKLRWALQQTKLIHTEIKCLTKIKHVNVMKIYAYNLDVKYPLTDGGTLETIMLVLEYCRGGELFDILYYAERLNEISARTYFHQLVCGLQAIHEAGIVHRDIKPQNLLLDRSFNLKICDFGLSKIFETGSIKLMKTTHVGTRGYQAPEIVKREKNYTKAVDIFSAGVVLFLLLAGYPPFEAAHHTDKWFNPLTLGDSAKFWHYHRKAGLSEDAKILLDGMFSHKARNRWTLQEIIKCNWFNNKVLKEGEIKSIIIGRYKEARKKKNAVKNKRRTPWLEEVSVPLSSSKPIPVGLVPTGLTTFYLGLPPVSAIFLINCIFQKELLIETTYKPDSLPYQINCRANIEGRKYEFLVKSYQDEEGEHKFLQIQATVKPDPLQWTRLYRKILDEISHYEILVNNLPACMQLKDVLKEPEDVKTQE